MTILKSIAAFFTSLLITICVTLDIPCYPMGEKLDLNKFVQTFEDEFEGESKIVLNKDLPRDLGEIFICSDVCIAQAKEYNHSLKREMTFLFTHGLLHLLGYDHMVKEDEEEMFKLQDEIMEVLGL